MPFFASAIRRIPAIYLELGLLGLLLVGLSQLAPAGQLIFIPSKVAAGEWWRLPAHPFIHVSGYHLAVDGAAFLFLYCALKGVACWKRGLFTVASAMGSALLAMSSPVVDASGLGGLSGTAHGLTAILALDLATAENKSSRHPALGGTILAILIGKSIIETLSGQVLFETAHPGHIGTPVPACHLGGVLGGIAAFAAVEWRRLRHLFYQTDFQNASAARPDTTTPTRRSTRRCKMTRQSDPGRQRPSSLLKSRRFAPLFWTQFLGAFNDNLFKSALMMLIAFRADGIGGGSHGLMNLAAGLFILPFFLFSPTAGQMADRAEKSGLIRRIKMAEVLIMGAAGAALYTGCIPALLALLFLMGAQSSFFGPLKYSLLPQHLKSGELVKGNALIEAGTFSAILLGTIAGGLLARGGQGCGALSFGVLMVAVLGWLASRKIPSARPPARQQRLTVNPITQIWRTLGRIRQDRPLFLAMVGAAGFWFLGASYLTQMPAFTRDVSHGNPAVATLLLAMFTVGIGAGSILCHRLSGQSIELGLVPVGAAGIGMFGMDLTWAWTASPGDLPMGLAAFLGTPGSIRLLADLILVGISGGLFIVPLTAFIQQRSAPEIRSQVIASGNVMSALFMVGASVAGYLLLDVAGLSIPEVFRVLAAGSAVIAVFGIRRVPTHAARCLAWVLTRAAYRIRPQYLDRLPATGPAIIVCNHVSYVDALILMGLCRRPIRFVMYYRIFNIPVLRGIFRAAGAIPIASRRENESMYNQAFETIAAALDAGEIVGIFPEGKLTRTGEIDEFKAGVEKIVRRSPVPVHPSALRGLWGSMFSRKHRARVPRRLFRRIEYVVGAPLRPQAVSAGYLRDVVCALRGSVA